MLYKGFKPGQPSTRLLHNQTPVLTDLLIATANGKQMKDEKGETVKVDFTQEEAVATLDHLIDLKSSVLVKAPAKKGK